MKLAKESVMIRCSETLLNKWGWLKKLKINKELWGQYNPETDMVFAIGTNAQKSQTFQPTTVKDFFIANFGEDHGLAAIQMIYGLVNNQSLSLPHKAAAEASDILGISVFFTEAHIIKGDPSQYRPNGRRRRSIILSTSGIDGKLNEDPEENSEENELATL